MGDIPRDSVCNLWQAEDVNFISDTHRLITQLTERGFTAQQAEALIEAAQEIDLGDVATKRDVADFVHQLEKLELRLTLKLGSLIAAGIGVLALLKYFG